MFDKLIKIIFKILSFIKLLSATNATKVDIMIQIILKALTVSSVLFYICYNDF